MNRKVTYNVEDKFTGGEFRIGVGTCVDADTLMVLLEVCSLEFSYMYKTLTIIYLNNFK